MDESLPIDIQTSKLVDWLISRRHVPRDWSSPVRIAREKINNAIKDMPEHPEITKLLSGTYINYYHCLRIVEILAETEKDSKNILGWYTSQRMKDWREVVQLYEKDAIYLGEAAQMLVRNVSYEIPALKRQIAKGNHIQEDCEKRETECVRNAVDANNKYNDMCNTIGIKGEKVKKELVDLLQDLPQEFNKIVKTIQSLSDARGFYLDFVTFTFPEIHRECLPLLKFITENGNVTVYEWTYGEAPISVEEPQLHFDIEEDNKSKDIDEINFDTNDEIDFGAEEIDLGLDEPSPGDIDWGDLSVDQQIDWDTNLTKTEETTGCGITLEESGVAGGIARDTEALTLLAYHKTREQCINELYELEGFLTQRRSELENERSVVSLNQFGGAPPSVQYQNKEGVDKMINNVQAVMGQLMSTKMQHLYLISTSQKYVDRLASSLNAKRAVGERLGHSKELLIVKRKQAGKEQQELSPKMQLIIERTKELQKQIENTISKKYNNRVVNLMGGVNVL